MLHLARNRELKAAVEASTEELFLLKIGLQAKTQKLDQTTSDQIRLLPSQSNQTSCTGKGRIPLQISTQITLGIPALVLIKLPEMQAQTILFLSVINFNADRITFVMAVNRYKQVEHSPIS